MATTSIDRRDHLTSAIDRGLLAVMHAMHASHRQRNDQRRHHAELLQVRRAHRKTLEQLNLDGARVEVVAAVQVARVDGLDKAAPEGLEVVEDPRARVDDEPVHVERVGRILDRAAERRDLLRDGSTLGIADVNRGLTFERAGRCDVKDQSARAFEPDGRLGREDGGDPVSTPCSKSIRPVTAREDRLANATGVELTVSCAIPDIERAAKATLGTNHVGRSETLANTNEQDRPSRPAVHGMELEISNGELRIERRVEVAPEVVAVRIEVEASESVQRVRDPVGRSPSLSSATP